MDTSVGGAQVASASAQSGQLDVAVLRKALNQQRAEGDAALKLIEQANAVSPSADSRSGRTVDRYA
jgi:hypothetical protein